MLRSRHGKYTGKKIFDGSSVSIKKESPTLFQQNIYDPQFVSRKVAINYVSKDLHGETKDIDEGMESFD